MRFGIREICDVVLRAKGTQKLGSRTYYKNEPVLYFDTLKTSSLEGSATTVYATGGRGNSRLIAWEGERTLTFTFEDALLSMESFSILTGAGLMDASVDKPVYVHQTSQVEVSATNTIILEGVIACWSHTATGTPSATEEASAYYHNAADIFCMVLNDAGEIEVEPCVPKSVEYVATTLPDGTTRYDTKIVCYADGSDGHVDLTTDDIVFVDYYVKRTAGASMIEITPDKFGGYYYLEASTLWRRESDGVDMPAEFIIPRMKVQSNFTFSMAATGDPSTFSFVCDAFPDYTKFDRTKKVLAAIQVISDETLDDDLVREPCDASGE